MKLPAMQKSLLNRIALSVLAFFAALLLELGISYYQNAYVTQPQERRSQQIRIISQFLNGVEQSIQALSDFRWDYDEIPELIQTLDSSQEEASQLLSQLDLRLGQGSEEQYLLSNASATTYRTFSELTDEIQQLLQEDRRDEAAELFYASAAPCGSYMRQYIQQLLECAIRDSQSAYSQLSRRSNLLERLQLAVSCLCMLLAATTAYSLFILLRSVRQMASASVAISRGDLDTPDVDESRQDEIGHMARAFNEMKRSMKRQVQTLEEKNEMERTLFKKENEALELRSLMEQEKLQKLRSQINPHFLFNTLNVILYTARQEGAEKTQSLIASLSSLFRYALGSNASLVPLAREVRIVDAFYALNKVRFGDRVALHWSYSPDIDLTETLTPSFLIQPLVENAFKHGIVPKEEGGTVEIRIEPEGDLLKILVSDDGVGIPEEALEDLRRSLLDPTDRENHIGLANVSARLRLLGEAYGLSIHSLPGSGTQVELRLPLVIQQSDEETEYEDSDSR